MLWNPGSDPAPYKSRFIKKLTLWVRGWMWCHWLSVTQSPRQTLQCQQPSPHQSAKLSELLPRASLCQVMSLCRLTDQLISVCLYKISLTPQRAMGRRGEEEEDFGNQAEQEHTTAACWNNRETGVILPTRAFIRPAPLHREKIRMKYSSLITYHRWKCGEGVLTEEYIAVSLLFVKVHCNPKAFVEALFPSAPPCLFLLRFPHQEGVLYFYWSFIDDILLVSSLCWTLHQTGLSRWLSHATAKAGFYTWLPRFLEKYLSK